MDNKGNTPLPLICKEGQCECDCGLVEMFFEIATEVNQPVQVNARDKLGNTPLHWAIERDKKCVGTVLLKRGASPNLIGARRLTPLQLICARSWSDRNYDLVKILLDKKNYQPWQIDKRDEGGRTPLLLALQSGSKKTAELLLSRGASPKVADDKTPIHIICQESLYVDMLEILLEARAVQRLQGQDEDRDNLDDTPSANEDGKLKWETLIIVAVTALLFILNK
ncbi:hypothetical protein TKK_0002251 [Trichogramma kaykai]